MQNWQAKLQSAPATPNNNGNRGSFFKKNISSGLNFLRKSSKTKERNASAAGGNQKGYTHNVANGDQYYAQP